MTDRLPNSPGKYSAVVTGGELQKMQTGKPFAITLQLDDDPVREGTPYSKAAVLPDELAAKLCPETEDPAPKDAFRGLWEKKADGIRRKSGTVISIEDSAHTPLKGLKLFGKTIQNGTPTPTAPVELESVGASGNIVVTVSGEQGNQTVTASTPNGLPGIPVSSDGNYTDENGQQWICDEIDFARGKYVKRVESVRISSGADWKSSSSVEGRYFYNVSFKDKALPLCTHFKTTMEATTDKNKLWCNQGVQLIFNTDFVALEEWKTYLDENEVHVLFGLNTPIETALSTEELEAYALLHTNKPNTTVFNDAGAGMEITYYTPTTPVQMVHSPADAGKILSIDEHGCVVPAEQKDRIVEQGVSGNWTYRKWDSGIAECWMKYAATADGSNTFGGSPAWDKFYRSHTSEIPLPVVFTEVPMFNVSVSGGTVVIFNGTTYVSNSMVNMIQLNSYVRTEDTSKSYSIIYCVHAIGRWK